MAQLSRCPGCDRAVRVPDNLVGQPVKCPTCGEVFTAALEAAPPLAEREPIDERPERGPADVPPRRPEGDDCNDYTPRPRRRRYDAEPHRGTLILVLGILSLVFMGIIGLILGPMAWVMGNGDIRKIRAGRMDRDGEGSTNAGRICGIIGTVASVCVCFCIVGVFTILVLEEVDNQNMQNNFNAPPPAPPQFNPAPRRRFEAPAPPLRLHLKHWQLEPVRAQHMP